MDLLAAPDSSPHRLPHRRIFLKETDSSTFDFLQIYDILSDMQTNVSTLLREFPRVRQAAMRGESVIIKTREGNLVLSAEQPRIAGLLGKWKGRVRVAAGVDLTMPTTSDSEWGK